jgi:hypothetical protein
VIDLNKVLVAFVRGGFDGLASSIEDLMGRAVQDAPIDEGTLRQSAVIIYIVNGTRFEGANARQEAENSVVRIVSAGLELDVRAELSFNTPYAAAQHEGIALQIRDGKPVLWQVHNHPKGGRSKYLEANLLEMAPRYQAVIGANAKKALDSNALHP